jgi:hypothetical protein
MNLKGILISESEKNRILGMHSDKKSLGLITEGFNPADQIYTLDAPQLVQATIDFGTVFPKTIAKGTKIYRTNAYDRLWFGNTGFVMYCNRDLFVYKDGIDDLRIGTGDVRNNSLRKILADIYCTDAKLTKDKKLKNWDELAKDGNKKDRPKFDGSKEEVTVRPPSRDCKEKCSRKQKVRTPSDEIQYQSQYQGYFYDSIKGKCIEVTGESGPFGSIAECEACKCNGQINVGDGNQIKIRENEICRLPGDKVWIYSKKGDIWYTSKDGGKTWIKLDPIKFKSAIDLLNRNAVCGGNQKPGDIGILPTTDRLLECATKHLKITQLPISCTSTASNIMPTDPTQCFNDILKGIDQQIVIDFIICLFGDKEIPKIIRELPLPGTNIPIGDLPGLKESPGDGVQKPNDGSQKPNDGSQKPGDEGNKLPDFIPPTIVKPIRPLD